MRKLLLLLALLIIMPFNVNAQEKKTAAYFYADWCSHCQKVNKYFQENDSYQKYDIQKFNFDEKENKALLSKIIREKGGSDVGIPAIIIDEEIILGDQTIIAEFEKKMSESEGTSARYVERFGGGKLAVEKQKNEVKKAEKKDARAASEGVELPLLLGAAVSDAFNPCAFAVLILLIATVLKGQGKKRALWSGLLFSLAIFISYFLMGLGLYNVISIFNIPKYFSLAVGILAILIGLANLKDTFWYGKFFVMEVPLSWRPKMQTILKHVTSPGGAFFAGILVSLFLLPCSSGPYVVIVGLLAERVNVAVAASQLLLYNLIFVLPMVMITLGMYFFNVKMVELEKMRKGNLKVLHAIVGTIMVLMGLYLIQGWV